MAGGGLKRMSRTDSHELLSVMTSGRVNHQNVLMGKGRRWGGSTENLRRLTTGMSPANSCENLVNLSRMGPPAHRGSSVVAASGNGSNGPNGVKPEESERRPVGQQPHRPIHKNESTNSLRSMLSMANEPGASLTRNMSTDSMGLGAGSVGMGGGASSTLDLQGLLQSGSQVDLGSELYEDSLNLQQLPRSDSAQSLEQMLGINSQGSSANLEMLAGRQAHTAHTMDRQWEW